MSVWPWTDVGVSDALTLLLVGDTNLQGRRPPAEIFARILDTLRVADVLFGNLEGALADPSTDPAAPDIPHKQGWRHSGPQMAEALVAAGFSAVGCANNVTYGTPAILQSLATLDAAGIPHCGAGRNRDEARRPVIVERRGARFGFLSYTSVFWPVGHAAGPEAPGVATIKATTAYQPHPRVLEMPGAPAIVVTTPDPQELDAMVADVRRLREQADVVVVSCHWGVSGSNQVVDYQRTVGRAAIAAGADVVIGHHPHVMQAVEVWRGRPIFYSLANFAFGWDAMRGHRDGLLVRGVIHGRRLTHVSFVPVRRDAENRPELLHPAEGPGREITEQVRALSAGSGTQFRVEGAEVVVNGVK